MYCSLRPLIYGMTTLAPVISFAEDGFGFLLGFALLKEICWVMAVLKDFVNVIHFFCKELRCRTYCLALWMRVWKTNSFAEMVWLEL